MNEAEENARWRYAAEMIDAHGAVTVKVLERQIVDAQSRRDQEALDFWMDIAERIATLVSADSQNPT